MKKHAWTTLTAAFGAGCLALLPATAQADVTVHKTVLFEEGLTGITSHTTDETDYIQGDKKREEDLRKFTGSVLGGWQRFRGENNGSASVDIYLVGQNQHYDMDPSKKTYSLSAIYDPQQPDKSQHPENQGQAQQQNNGDVKVTKNEVTVKETGQKKNINGFDTAEYVITWEVDTENTKTGDKGKDLMTADLWNSTDSLLAKAVQEEATYSKAYLKLMQVPTGNMKEMTQYGLSGLNVSMDSADQQAFLDKLHSIKGYSVSADVRWEVAGTDANGKQTNTSNNDQSHPQNLDSALGSLFGSKSSSTSSDSSKPAGTPGMTTIFHSNIEIKSVDMGSIAATQFQVPADYQKD